MKRQVQLATGKSELVRRLAKTPPEDALQFALGVLCAQGAFRGAVRGRAIQNPRGSTNNGVKLNSHNRGNEGNQRRQFQAPSAPTRRAGRDGMYFDYRDNAIELTRDERDLRNCRGVPQSMRVY